MDQEDNAVREVIEALRMTRIGVRLKSLDALSYVATMFTCECGGGLLHDNNAGVRRKRSACWMR
jgi:hypothetical protein